MRGYLISILLLCNIWYAVVYAQPTASTDSVLSLSDYLSQLYTYHPLVKQAKLVVNKSEAELTQARGSFDPKLEADYTRKNFKDTRYFDNLSTTLKYPVWYGIDLKANYERNLGEFINPQNILPPEGLYSAGISIPLLRGLFTNERMAALERAKLYAFQARAEQQLMVSAIISDAVIVYLEWLRSYREVELYRFFLKNAEVRYEGVRRNYYVGEKPAIDTVEARISVGTRQLNLEKAYINYAKSSLKLSNYLWVDNNMPALLPPSTVPQSITTIQIDSLLSIPHLESEIDLSSHPKVQSLAYKYKRDEVQLDLYRNQLLPELELEYNFLTTTPDNINSIQPQQYKGGVKFSFPLFLRKERGKLELSRIKLQSIDYDIQSTMVSLKNKIKTTLQQILSYHRQQNLVGEVVRDYQTLLEAEERKYQIGESTLFLINSRESKLIDARLKRIEIDNVLLALKAQLFGTMAIEISDRP